MDLSAVIAKGDIERGLNLYAKACDHRLWDLLDEVFIEEVEAHYGGYAIPGLPAIKRMIMNSLGGCGPTQHQLTNFFIDVTDEYAESVCSVRASHSGDGEHEGVFYEVWGEYRDKWRLTKAGWRIHHRQMIILHETGSRDVLKPHAG